MTRLVNATTLLDLLQDVAADRLAVQVPGGPTISYGMLRTQVARLSQQLSGLGIQQSDAVAIVLPNGLEMVVSLLAAAVTGTAVPLNPTFTKAEFAFYLEDAGARVVIVPETGAPAARAAADAQAAITPRLGHKSWRRAARSGPCRPRTASDTVRIIAEAENLSRAGLGVTRAGPGAVVRNGRVFWYHSGRSSRGGRRHRA